MDKKPVRTFLGTEGDKSINAKGPDALKSDFDMLCKMFDPDATHSDGKQGGISTTNLRDAIFTDEKIGPKTVDDSIVDPIANTGTFTQILSWMAKQIKIVTGETNWRVAPTKNFKQVTQETEAATVTAGNAVTTAEGAVTTANNADTKADTAINTANLAVGAGVEESGTATSTTVNTLTHTGKTWVINSLIGRRIRITSGTKHTRIVTANTADTITVDDDLETGIGSTPTYELEVATIFGAEGATMTAEAVKWDYDIKKPEIEQAVIDANNAVSSVALKVDKTYVDSELAAVVLGQIPDGSLGDEKFNQDLFDKINNVPLDYGIIIHSADAMEDYGTL